MTVPTLRDVAALAGVSMSTVSRVLNDKDGVAPTKRTRVEHALQQLDYVTNMSARSLRGTKSRTYGLLVDDLTTGFFSGLAEALTRSSLQDGCNLLIVTTQKDYEREKRIVADMRARQVDGLFIVPASGDTTGHRLRHQSGVPIVYVERFPTGLDADVVTFDYYQAGIQQIEQLWSDGHRRIAFLGGDVTEDPGRRRIAAFRDGLRTHGVTPDPDLISTGHLTEDTAIPVLERFRQMPKPPTALVVTVAPMLRPALRLASEHAWNIEIASYESIDTPSLSTVPLVVTRGNLDELAQRAAALLRARVAESSGDTDDSTVAMATAHTELLLTAVDRFGPTYQHQT